MLSAQRPLTRALPSDWTYTERKANHWTPSAAERKLMRTPVVIDYIDLDEDVNGNDMEAQAPCVVPCVDLTDDSMEVADFHSMQKHELPRLPTFAEAYSGRYGAAPADYTSGVRPPQYEMTTEDYANDAVLFGQLRYTH